MLLLLPSPSEIGHHRPRICRPATRKSFFLTTPPQQASDQQGLDLHIGAILNITLRQLPPAAAEYVGYSSRFYRPLAIYIINSDAYSSHRAEVVPAEQAYAASFSKPLTHAGELVLKLMCGHTQYGRDVHLRVTAEERRVDPSDGKVYTKQEFEDFYGPECPQWELALQWRKRRAGGR